MSVHTAIASKAGLSPDEQRSARDGSLDAYARFAHEVSERRGHLTDEAVASAREAGLSEAVLVEIIAQITVLTFTNLLNNVAKTQLDFPAVPL